MRINIFGLGYVGCVSSVGLANLGHDVTGIDVDHVKVDMLNRGISPIVEPGLQEALQQAFISQRLRAINDRIDPADVSMICVGTPSNSNGSLRLDYVLKVVEQIGTYLRELPHYHVVVVRSTVLPSTVTEMLIPLLEKCSHRRVGPDFGVCMNPEFMREGTALADFYAPVFTLIGEHDGRCGGMIEEVYQKIEAPVIHTNIKNAEMIKYTCNAFHALKVAFANEIGNICKKMNIDSHEVMDIFCRDKELNISSQYLRPGFAFGGSCLPKDVRALIYKANQLELESPLLRSVLISNHKQIDMAFEFIRAAKRNKIGILGLSFKSGTDDLRESPIVEIIEKLIGKGYRVSIYDREVSLAKLYGANKQYIEHAIPHISGLLKESVREVIDDAEVVVVTKKTPEFEEIVTGLSEDKTVIDLVRITPDSGKYHANYEGICW